MIHIKLRICHKTYAISFIVTCFVIHGIYNVIEFLLIQSMTVLTSGDRSWREFIRSVAQERDWISYSRLQLRASACAPRVWRVNARRGGPPTRSPLPCAVSHAQYYPPTAGRTSTSLLPPRRRPTVDEKRVTATAAAVVSCLAHGRPVNRSKVQADRLFRSA